MEIENQKSEAELIIESAKLAESEAKPFTSPIKQKRKPGRPKNSEKAEAGPKESEKKAEGGEPQKPQFNIPTKVICYPIVKVVSAVGVSYVGDPRAALSADEAEGMAGAIGMVLDKYMPDAMSKYGPELVLGLSLGQYGLRLYAIKKLQQEKLMREAAMKAQPQAEARPQEGASTLNFDEPQSGALQL